MAKHLAPYRTYVIRCWEEPSSQAGNCIYRFSLEIPATGERFGFTSPEELVKALELAFAQLRVQRRMNADPKDEPG